MMEWSKQYATDAYLDTLKLCHTAKEKCDSCGTKEPKSTEFISALAAGMSAKLMVEVTSEVSPSTVALAAAARQTGGRVVCILPQLTGNESKQVIEESGLNDIIEFRTGDPLDVLPNYENIDFSLVDCKSDVDRKVFETLDINPRRSVVVANNLVEGRKGLGCHLKGVENEAKVRSMNHPIGKGMEITVIGKSTNRKRGIVKKTDKSKWIVKIDEKTGEEHIYRIPRSKSFSL